ncbi:MAG TPA: J domain-containing protein [Thermoanaerobaculia bacterium]|nr:J domain-containing protein [Thermoanaerobaculia bacterium]
MELIAVLVMMIVGGGVAIFVLIAFAIAKSEKPREHAAATNRHEIAASILFQVMIAGGSTTDDALRQVRRGAGLAARVTPGVDLSSWGASFAQVASSAEREQLLETAVQLAIERKGPIPLRQYAALLDLSFGLGFHTDALARLREKYGFEYVDHAKDARPLEADRGGGATPLFVRDESGTVEWLHVLQIEGAPTRQVIIAAYRRLVVQHHPDRFHDAPDEQRRSEAARFIELTRAYEHLLAIYRD